MKPERHLTSGFFLKILLGQKLHLYFFSPDSSASSSISSGSLFQTMEWGLETAELESSRYSVWKEAD